MFGCKPLGVFSKTYNRLFSTNSNTKYTMPFFLNAYFIYTMLGCDNIFKILTSLMVVFLVNSSSSESLNFFIATFISF